MPQFISNHNDLSTFINQYYMCFFLSTNLHESKREKTSQKQYWNKVHANEARACCDDRKKKDWERETRQRVADSLNVLLVEFSIKSIGWFVLREICDFLPGSMIVYCDRI